MLGATYVGPPRMASGLHQAPPMSSSGSQPRLPRALSDTAPLAPPRLAPRRSGAAWPATARTLVLLAEIAGRVSEMGTSGGDPADMDAAREQGDRMLTAIDDAMTAAIEVEAAAGQGHSKTALFAESADLLTDLVVMGNWTLQRKRARLLEAMSASDASRVGDACASARRAVIRTLAAIERALLDPETKLTGVARLMAKETERSLRVRGLYRAFRAALRLDAPPSPSTLDARLTAAGVALAGVLEGPHARDLRASDRRLFRELSDRLSAFRGEPRTEITARAGMRLWQDMAAFAGCLRTINLRAELAEHDARAAQAALASMGDRARVDDGVLEALGALLGRDDELDALLLGRGPVHAAALGPLLERLSRR